MQATAAAASKQVSGSDSPWSAALGGLLADYDSDSDSKAASDGEGTAAHVEKKRMGAGKISFRKLETSAKAEYRHDKYEKRKAEPAKQDSMVTPFLHSVQNEKGWLIKDLTRGWHCRVCVSAIVKPNDKLSTGYGYEGSGEVRMLVPIPTQWRRQMSRGFDHTWLLAQAIRSRHAGRIVVRPWLRNLRYRPPQHGLDRKKRLTGAQGRFRAHPKLAGHHITLIDDVITTGATVTGAASALRLAGARSVDVWCLARTPAPSHAR